MGMALYESVVPGIPGHISTAGTMYQFNDVTLPEPGAQYHWPTVANNALTRVIDTLFRTATVANKDSLIKITAYYNDLFASQVSAQIFNDSKSFGESIGTDIINYSRTDGAHNGFATNFPPGYIPPVGDDLWVPYGTQVALQPYWGNNRPFIEADSSADAISPPPPPFSTVPGSEFYEYAYQVYETGLNLTQEQMNIATYWADGGGTITPPGHSISMLKSILIDENANLEMAAIAYAKLGIAVSDAFLACWKTKYIYNLCRPVTYIRTHIDSNWLPLIGTPPFPEYTSGHSSQSGAMSAVMSDIFGPAYSFTDMTHGSNFGGPRSFDSFEEAAREAAVSRLYGGIHYEFGNEAGLDLGYFVGNNVNNLFEELNVATEEHNPMASLNIFPNPAVETLTVSGTNLYGTSYQLIDLYGKVLTDGKLNDQVTTLSIGMLTPGIYILQAGNDYRHTYKVVKN